jgi:hypothetical protein
MPSAAGDPRRLAEPDRRVDEEVLDLLPRWIDAVNFARRGAE